MLAFFLGIEDKYVSLAYILCILSSALCIIYGIINWNRGDTEISNDGIKWAEQEKKVEEDL